MGDNRFAELIALFRIIDSGIQCPLGNSDRLGGNAVSSAV